MRIGLEIRQSPIASNGVFATRDFQKGEIVCEMTGEVCTLDEIILRIKAGTEAPADSLQIGDELYIDLDELPRCINHSCSPNTFLSDMRTLVARTDILIGTEITYDYSTTMCDDLEKMNKAGLIPWTCVCQCKSATCRRMIDHFIMLPDEIKRMYFERNELQTFVRTRC